MNFTKSKKWSRLRPQKLAIVLSVSFCIVALETGCSQIQSLTQKSTVNQGDQALLQSKRKANSDDTPPVQDTAVTQFTLSALNEEQASAAKQAQTEYIEAISYLKNGEHERALPLFQHIGKRFPKLSGPWVNQAIIHLHFNRFEEADSALKQALQIYPGNPYALNLKGFVLREKGYFKEAKESYQKALEIDKHYAKAHLNLGILADLYLRDLDLALVHFEHYQALQAKPNKRVVGWIKDLQRRKKAQNQA